MTTVVSFPALESKLPTAVDAERTFLGAVLILPVVFERCADIVSVSDFAYEPNRLIYAAITEVIDDGSAVDFVTVRHKLAEMRVIDRVENAGGPGYISGLIDNVPDIANAESYAGIVRRAAQRREMIAAGYAMAKRASDGESPEDLAPEFEDRLHRLKPAIGATAWVPMEEVATDLARMYIAGGTERGLSTGWPSVDSYYTIERGAWTLVTGIPSHGKTGWLDQLMVNVAKKHDWRIAMFSAENHPASRHAKDLIEKLVSAPFNEGPSARMTLGDVERGLAFLSRHFRFINPMGEGMTVDRILALATEEATRIPVDVLTIDPWNEVQHDVPEGLTETQYISLQLSKVRRWARKHNAHVYVVAHPQKMQKNRETGQYDPPTPYDVSGGAHWRNKADYSITIYRDMVNGDDDPAVSVYVQKARRREIGRQGRAVLNYVRVTGEYHDPVQPRAPREFYGD